MDRLRRQRRPVRARITKAVIETEAELTADPLNNLALQAKFEKFDELLEEVSLLDNRVCDALLDAGCTDEEQDEEDKTVEEYKDKIRLIKIKLDHVLNPRQRPGSPAASEYTTASAGESKKRNFKLPKIELKKFNGELEDWLGWWAQFSKIHEDGELHEADKFQYLIQGMVPGTRASNLVNSYPATVENYPKVIETLQDRFGDKALLAEVYIRKLQSVVLGFEKTKSHVDLCKIFDNIETQLRCLESLEVTLDHSAFMLPLIESTLSVELIKVWQRSPESGYLDDEKKTTEERLKSLMKFMKREVKGEERIKMIQGKTKEPNTKFKRSIENDVPTSQSLFSESAKTCLFCERANHNSQDCRKAIKMSLEERSQKVKGAQGCFSCFKKGHTSKFCKRFVKCSICEGKHYDIMCRNRLSSNVTESVAAMTEAMKQSTVNRAVANASQTEKDGLVLMKTVRVNILNSEGHQYSVRLLFDEGSNRSYIKTATAENLNCPVIEKFNLQTTLFGGQTTTYKPKKKYKVRLQSSDRKFTSDFQLINEDVICGSCPSVPKGPWMQELSHQKIFLNDVGSSSTEIEILIGSNLWPKLMTGRMHKLKTGLIAVESVFGWTLSGEIPVQKASSNFASLSIAMWTHGEITLPELWQLEAIGIKETSDKLTQEEHDQKVNQKFQENISRAIDGRYIIKLPWIDNNIHLPSNKNVCMKRLQSTSSKLQNEKLYDTYAQIFCDWEQEGIIEAVTVDSAKEHYLPHHRILKPDSKTTPVRPVFDASCKVGNHPSLNDCLERGPNWLELIPSLLLRFREKDIGVISDIRKAFQMIQVADEDKNCQKFLWWEDYGLKELKVYRHSRVVFGMNCSPFVLAAVLNYHLNHVKQSQETVAELLKHSMYVDNCVISLDNAEEYKMFKEMSISILADAKMDLRQWESNSEQSIEDMTSVLGLLWNKRSDYLTCKVPTMLSEDIKINKRSVLSIVAKIYDPIGYTCPSILVPKLLLQSAWMQKWPWDQEWDSENTSKFLKWFSEIKELQWIEIPRVSIGSGIDELQLHLFTDASQDAFAAVVYARVHKNGCVGVQLLLAKSRLAPVPKKENRRTTIPRLELLGCVIGARLLKTVKESLRIKEEQIICWCDSTTALAWIKRDEDWGTFVGNRVREINQISLKDQWRHVPGPMNPADLPSRGCSPYELRQSRWWEGPSWLYKDADQWPNSQPVPDEDIVAQEKRKTQVLNNVNIEVHEPKFSSYWRNLKEAAWIRRFVTNLRVKERDRVKSDHLSQEEMKAGELDLFREIQKRHFPGNKVVQQIHVNLEQDGLLHVKTRLTYKEDTEMFKSPILLPSSEPLVHQLIDFVHKMYCHAGTQFVLNKLRERYWILKGRRTVNRVIRDCVTCRRFSTKPLTCEQSPLPAARMETQFAFQTTGVDLAGPLYLKGGKKAWVVIYTCAVYRGVYLDVVDGLSSGEFLNSLHKFTCIIGRPSMIFSDNGTNFVGAQTIMKMLNWNKLSAKLQVQRIKWRFNPPTAAWWGGWWERLIRTLKDLLRRMIKTAKLTRKELETCMAEISFVMNNRPLTTLTENEADLTPLTPAMFMKDLPISGLPEVEEITGRDLQEAHCKLTNLKRALKARFRKEYLGNLLEKRTEKTTAEPKVGDVVLVGSDKKKRFEWPLGRIQEIIQGKDNKVRVVRVKTQNGILVRPIQRLYPLEIRNASELPLTKDIVQCDIQDQVTEESEEKVSDDEEQTCTRYGRKVKKPQRYGQWFR